MRSRDMVNKNSTMNEVMYLQEYLNIIEGIIESHLSVDEGRLALGELNDKAYQAGVSPLVIKDNIIGGYTLEDMQENSQC